MSRTLALGAALLILSGLPGVVTYTDDSVETVNLSNPTFTDGSVSVGLFSPFNYALMPPGTEISLNITGTLFTQVRYSIDGGGKLPLSPPYSLDTSSWLVGTHFVGVEVLNGASIVASKTFVFFVDSEAVWPPDTIPVDVILVGFDVSPVDLEARLIPRYEVTIPLDDTWEVFDFNFQFSVQSAGSSYHDGLLGYLQSKATYHDSLQGRLNLPALIDQRNSGTVRDIFDSLEGWEIKTEWAELYLEEFPPLPSIEDGGYTFYLLNLTALDDPLAGVDHWFVQDTLDPDTLVAQDWWRLEWDNDLNTPMAYPLNTWGGPSHKVHVDPTAYQWYLDWTYIWWQGGNDRAPYGLQYEEVDQASRLDYLSGILNDLVEGLAATLPWAPPAEPSALIRNYVLSGSLNYTLDELLWVSSDVALESYLEEALPFKEWTVETTFDLIENYSDLSDFVDSVTTFIDDRGLIDGGAVWDYLFSNKDQFVGDDPDAFEILSINLLYDNRSMFAGGREFTGLGGSGITAIFLKTDRLFYSDGRRQKGLTSVISHESGHNLGYGHQFGPNYRSDFVEGNMGYFRNDLGYGLFWENALQRLYLRQKLRAVLSLLDAREPLRLGPEFTAFYRDYHNVDLLQAYEDLVLIDEMLTDSVAPTANAGPDLTVPEDSLIVLDGSGSGDNFRILNYTWSFGDGTHTTMQVPLVQKTWTDPGTYDVTLRVHDAAGNSAEDMLAVNVTDITPPTLTIMTPLEGARLSSADVQIGWNVTDNGPGIQRIDVTLDGGDPIALDGDVTEYTLTGVGDGYHVVTVTAFDKGENQDVDLVSFHVGTGLSQPIGPLNLWSVLILAVGSAVLIGVGLYLRRRYRREHGPPRPPVE